MVYVKKIIVERGQFGYFDIPWLIFDAQTRHSFSSICITLTDVVNGRDYELRFERRRFNELIEELKVYNPYGWVLSKRKKGLSAGNFTAVALDTASFDFLSYADSVRKVAGGGGQGGVVPFEKFKTLFYAYDSSGHPLGAVTLLHAMCHYQVRGKASDIRVLPGYGDNIQYEVKLLSPEADRLISQTAYFYNGDPVSVNKQRMDRFWMDSGVDVWAFFP